MKGTLSSEERRHVRTSLFASLAFVAALLSSSLAWSGVNTPAARTLSLTAAAPAAPEAIGAVEATSNDDLGCGCDEACLVAN